MVWELFSGIRGLGVGCCVRVSEEGMGTPDDMGGLHHGTETIRGPGDMSGQLGCIRGCLTVWVI